ncbi:MAG TPA: RNA polymerase sigma factor [Flavisolibacter sp.]
MSIPEFNNLVLTHSDSLRPFAITLTRDPESARDLCQETLYKAFAYRQQYRQGTSIRAWLFTIMKNVFINEYRRSLRKRRVMENVRQHHPVSAPPAEQQVHVREITAAIHGLSDSAKAACLLYLEGHKYQEIAEALDEPLGTIKSRIHFAKKELQKKIER